MGDAKGAHVKNSRSDVHLEMGDAKGRSPYPVLSLTMERLRNENEDKTKTHD